MKEDRDYSIIFSKLASDVTEKDLANITQSIQLSFEVDPNIQEMVNYIESVNLPAFGEYSGI